MRLSLLQRRSLSLILLFTLLFSTSMRSIAQGADGLPQTYTAPDKAFTLNYPEKWVYKDLIDGSVAFAVDDNSLAVARKSGSPVLESGQFFIQVEYFPTSREAPKGIDISSPKAFMNSLAKQSPSVFKFGEIESVTIGAFEMASVAVSDKGFDGRFYTFMLDKIPFFVAAVAAPKEYAASRKLVESILQTTSVVGANKFVLAQTGSTPDKAYTFNYPSGWALKPNSGGQVIVGTSTAAIDATMGQNPTLKAGELVIQIGDFVKGGSAPSGIKLDADASALLKSLFSSAQSDDFKVGDIETFKLGELEAARVTITTKGIEGIVYASTALKIPFVMLGATAPGELKNNLPLIESIALSIQPKQAATKVSGTPAAVLELSQTFTFPDRLLQMSYPDKWVIKTVSGNVFLANSEGALADATSATPQMRAGGVAILIQEKVSFTRALSQSDLTNLLKNSMPSKGPGATVEEPENYRIGTVDTIRMKATDTTLDAIGYAFVIEKNASFVIVAGAASGELDTFTPTIEAIIKSIQLRK